MSSDQPSRVTLHDVARLAGVSIATVSYVLNGRKDRRNGPSPEVTERVRKAVDTLGYRVNTSARTLRRLRTELVAIVYRPPVGPWLEQLVRQTEDFAVHQGYSLICVPIYRDSHIDRSLQVITRGYVDGVILTYDAVPASEIEEVARGAGALITFDDELPAASTFDIVRVGERPAIAEATSYLLEQGRERVAYVTHENNRRGLRQLGYTDALAEAGHDVDPALVVSLSEEGPRASAALRELLSRAPRPDGLVCASDRSALSALQVARELGLAIPGDLAIIGVGNTSYAELSDPPLTSVGIPRLDFTPVIAALFERINDQQLGGRELSLNWELNLRQTT